MKRLYKLYYSLIIILIMSMVPSYSQMQTEIILTGEEVNRSSDSNFPFAEWSGGQRTQVIYSVEELTAAGLQEGGTINRLSLFFVNGTENPVRRFRIRIAEVDFKYFESGWNTEFFNDEASLEVVKGADDPNSTFAPGNVENQWVDIPFDREYTWTGGNLLVEIDWSNNSWGYAPWWPDPNEVGPREYTVGVFVSTADFNNRTVAGGYYEKEHIGTQESGSAERAMLMAKFGLNTGDVAPKLFVKPKKIVYKYIEPGATSEIKSANIMAYNVQPGTKILVTPSDNIQVSIAKEGEEWISSPDALELTKEAGKNKIEIWAKMIADENEQVMGTVEVSCLGIKKEISFNGNTDFLKGYCVSGAKEENGIDIGKVLLKYGNEEILNIGDSKPVVSNEKSVNKYTDNTKKYSIQLTKGEVYDLSVGLISSEQWFYTTNVVAYIDYNQDMEFTLDEMLFNANGTKKPNEDEVMRGGKFKVPTEVGTRSPYYLMRIVARQGFGFPLPCKLYDDGETEDFFVELKEPPPLFVKSVTCKQVGPQVTTAGAKNIVMLEAVVDIGGAFGDIKIKKLVFDTEGSYELQGIEQAKLLYYNAETKEFAVVADSIKSPNGDMVFEITKPIKNGNGEHKYYLLYDTKKDISNLALLDARLKEVYIENDETNYVNEVIDPKGVTAIIKALVYEGFEDYNKEFKLSSMGPSIWKRLKASGTYNSYAWFVDNAKSYYHENGMFVPSGEKYALFYGYGPDAKYSEILISPVFDLSDPNAERKVNFLMWKGNAYNKQPGIKIEVYISNQLADTVIDEKATKLIPLGKAKQPMNSLIGKEPKEQKVGWYSYTFQIPDSYKGKINRLYFKAYSDWYNRTGIDNVLIGEPVKAYVAVIDTIPSNSTMIPVDGKNKLIAGLNIKVKSDSDTLTLEQIEFDLTGTTDISNDIEQIKFWKMPQNMNNKAFRPEIGTVIDSLKNLKEIGNVITFNNNMLNIGDNKVYVTVDIKNTAKVSNIVDLIFKKIRTGRVGSDWHRDMKVNNGNLAGNHVIKDKLEGEYIVGGKESGDKYFKNINDALENLKELGAKGDVVFAINEDITIEKNKMLVIEDYDRSKGNYSLTMYPKDEKRNITGQFKVGFESDLTGMINVVGLDNFIIDGRINRVEGDNQKGFKISNLDTTKNAHITALMLSSEWISEQKVNSFKNIQINNCEISGMPSANMASAYVTYGIRINGKNNKGLKIFNNTFNSLVKSVYVDITSNWDTVVSKVEIYDNEIGSDNAEKAINVGLDLANIDSLDIHNNKIFNLRTLYLDPIGINLRYNIKNAIVRNNNISDVYGTGNVTATGIATLGSDSTISENIKIYNNVIDNVISDKTGKEAFTSGIFVSYCQNVEVYHNTVNLLGDKMTIPGAEISTDMDGITAALLFQRNKNGKVKNNIFVNEVTTVGKSPGLSFIYYIDNDEKSEFDYNALGYNQEMKNNYFAYKIVGENRNQYETLEDYITINPNVDFNSVKLKATFEKNREKGTLSASTALHGRISAPAIAGLKDLKDIHGNTRPDGLVTKGADQVSCKYVKITDFPTKITNICAPGKGELRVLTEVGDFDDGVERDREGAQIELLYIWYKNGVPIDNVHIVEVDDNFDGIKEQVERVVNDKVFYPEVLEDNNQNPDKYSVKVQSSGKIAVSDVCEVTAEKAIKIVKETGSQTMLCSDSESTFIEVTAEGTISGYQWMKEVNDEWVPIQGENKNRLIVYQQNASGRYRVHIKGGENNCNMKQIYSSVTTVQVVDPVKDAVLISPQADENGNIKLCEGEPISVKLDVNKVKGTVFGYRWEELVDGEWVASDMERRDYITNVGFESESARPSYSGRFRLVVLGSPTCQEVKTITNEINITVDPYVKIVKNPEPTVICKGGDIKLTVEVDGENPKFKWMKDGKPISMEENNSANKPMLVIKNSKYEDAGLYQVQIEVDGCKKSSVNGKLISKVAPVFVMNEAQIIKQPEVAVALKGKTARLEVKTSGVGAPSDSIPDYQWYKGTIKLANGSKYNGVKSNILFINDVNEDDEKGAPYHVVIKSLCGNTLKSDDAKVKLSRIAFSKYLDDEVVCEGEKVTLSVETETNIPGNPKFTYEWHYVSGENDVIVGNDAKDITFVATTKNAGEYYVIAKVEGELSPIKSNIAEIIVNSKPVITKELGVTNVKKDEEFSLTVEADGNDLEYKWYRDGEEIEEAVSATLTLSESEIGSYTYRVEVSNDCGMAQSETTVNVGQNMADVEEVNYGFTVSNIIPNPVVSNEAKFIVNTNEASFAEISITDARGKSTKFFSGNIEGAKEFSVNTDGYVNGTYYLMININGKTITRTFVVVK